MRHSLHLFGLFLVCLCSITNASAQDTVNLQNLKTVSAHKGKTVDLIYTSVPPHLTATSTGTVYGKDIVKMPVTSLRNALTGRLAGVYTTQFSGQPGSDGVSLSLRGLDPLVIIDGIPRTLTIFDLEEIESITVLKDALSTAMLGVRGSNGALSITTRKGTVGKHNISFTAQTAFQQPLKQIKPLRAFDYATLFNEALKNDGIAPVYTDADLQKYKDGSDPYGHPDVDWVNTLFKSNASFNRYTLSFSGGGDVARYFVSAEHLNQKGILRTSPENKYNTNNDFKTYVIRSNIDVDLDKKISMGLHLLGRILNANQPGFGSDNILLNSLLVTPSLAYPIFNPNGSLGGTAAYPGNIYGQSIRSGYQLNYKRDVFADLYVKRTLDEVTKGLWIKGMLSFNATLSQSHFRAKSFATYKMAITGIDTAYQKFGTDGTQGNGAGIEYQARESYVEFALGYERNFRKHGISATVLANQDNIVNGSDLPLRYKGISARVQYDYNKKYIAEIAVGYNGSNRYPEGTRYKAFPAAGLAWNISQESFMKNFTWLNNLKLYGSAGKTGWDKPGYFVYNQYYFDGNGYTFGTSASGQTSMNELVLANPEIDYEKADKVNVGVDVAMLKNRLTVKAEYYYSRYYDLLMQRGKNTTTIGNSYPDENIGITKYSGLELTVGWAQSYANGFQYYINGNASTLKRKIIYQDEVIRPYEWMKRTGQRLGQNFGLTALGLFQTQDEINHSATVEGYTPQPGDIKYKDLNGDGIINQFDESPIGNTKPIFYYGLDLGFSYKGFDFSALIQGAMHRDIAMTGFGEWEFQFNGYGQAYEHQLNRWTPATAATATYPRLSAGTNINNHIFSSYWMHNGDYARLKFIELGYSLPKSLVGKIKLENIRVFVSALNLLTISSYDRVDPEVYLGIYPMQRVINTGITVKL